MEPVGATNHQGQANGEEEGVVLTAFISNHDNTDKAQPDCKERFPMEGVDLGATNHQGKANGEEEGVVLTAFINNQDNMDKDGPDCYELGQKDAEQISVDVPSEEGQDDWDVDVLHVQESKFDVIVWPVVACQKGMKKGLDILKSRHVLTVLFFLAFAAYFIVAMFYKFGDEGSARLLVCTILGLIIYTRSYLSRGGRWLYYKSFGKDGVDPNILKWVRLGLRWLFYLTLLGFTIWVIIDNGTKGNNFRALPGLFCFVILCIFLSTDPRRINWHTIVWGLGMQFLFAICTLKYKFGQDATSYMQNRLDEFFDNSKEPTKHLFGPETHQHQILLEALPIAFLISATMAVLYYLGAMQFIINVVGSFFSFIMDTQPVESVAVSSGIFLDGTTSLLALRPYLQYQSKSQLFIILTSVFSSLGGAYLAILAKFHVPISHILPAMVISAPATFAVCKLIVPETRPKDSKRNHIDIEVEEKKEGSLMDAIQSGAMLALPLLGNIIAVSFAFMAGISWLNHTFEWFGDRVGKSGFTLEYVLSYLLYPVALAMGIDPDECRLVGKLLGVRLLSSNLVSFFQMMPLVGNRYVYQAYMAATNNTGPVQHNGDDMFLVFFNKTLPGGIISERSQMITTYSLCGFSNVLCLAFTMAVVYTFVPKRRVWLSKIAIPALLAGNVANWMTGCFAGLFY